MAALTADVVVAGGGPAACAAAVRLARAGASVALFERERTPGAKVCGEFLSVEACAEAREIGVDPFDFGAAPIDRVRVSLGRTFVESRLPFTAASLSRATFDGALLDAAARAGARVARGVRVLAADAGRVAVRGDDGDATFQSNAVVLATGKSELAGMRRQGGHFPDALGFKMHLDPGARALEELGTAVELTLFDGGYAGMQRIEGGLVAFAIVVRRAAYARLGSWQKLVGAVAASCPRTARRLAEARERWPKPLAVSGVPYGYVFHDDAACDDGPFRVGDQLAVIPSFTGDGMAIALVTGAHAARAIEAGQRAAAFHASMRTRLARPMLVAGLLSRAIATPAGRAAVVWPARLVPPLFSAIATTTRIAR